MHKAWQLIKGLSFALYLFLIFYLMLRNEYLSELNGLPIWFIPAVCFISILYLALRYIQLSLQVSRLEHEFTSIVNHTFRTPITGIMWFTKELEKDLPASEKLLYLEGINNSANKILSIVDIFAGIKNINDISGYVFEATSIREIIEESIARYREDINRKNLTFSVSTFKDVPLLTVDLKKISFVVDTMVENAILYTPKDGKIMIECISGKKKLTLYVSDTGIGLNLKDKMRIFSRFYRGKSAILANPDGMGLRLHLSRKIIERHKGKMYAKSHGKDKGTTFFVELPFHSRSK